MKKSFASVNPAMQRYALVIFDMDGTLTEELLDFELIRREIGVPDEVGILEHISKLAGAEKSRAEEILHGHEMAAAATCAVRDGALAVLAALRAEAIGTALLTRNSGACAKAVLARHGLSLDYIATREHIPHKPHADSILNITRHFGVLPERTLMVGDYLYDVQAARNAGADSALLQMGEGPWPDFAQLATYKLRHLREVPGLVLGPGANE